MTRRLLASNLRRVLNPTTTPSPKPFSSPTSQQNPLSQSLLFSCQLKPHRSLFFSSYSYKLSRGQFIARWRNALPMRRLLTRGAHLLSFSSQWQGDLRQILCSMRIFWSDQILTPKGVILFLIGANVAVFVLWGNMDPSFMRKHFMISLDNFKSGRLHTLITSAFSHKEPGHIVHNMLGLSFFGTNISVLFGPKFLLNLYFVGALGGSIFFLVDRAFQVSSNQGYQGLDKSSVPALGASGAVYAIIFLKVFLFPKSLMYPLEVVPVPAALMGAFWIAIDQYIIFKGRQDKVAGSAQYLGGAFVAALVWALIKKRI